MLSNLLRFPMTFLAGTFLPFEQMPPALQIVARGLPLTYALDAVRIAIQEPAATASFAMNIAVLGAYSLGFLVSAAYVLQRKLE